MRELRRNFGWAMPRKGRSAARAIAQATTLHLIELPPDVLSLVLYHVPLAHDIALAGRTCRGLRDAVRLTFKARPFSGEVITLAGHHSFVNAVAVAPDGRVITGSDDHTVIVWRNGACERTIDGAHGGFVMALAVLPGGARFFSGSRDGTVQLWTFDGELERTFRVGGKVNCVMALPDGVHFVVGLGEPRHDNNDIFDGKVQLYHVDGTLVLTFAGHIGEVQAMAVTRDGQHIISGSENNLVRVWSVGSKSFVRACPGHDGNIFAVAVTPDGKRILSGGDASTIQVWLLGGTLENTFFDLHDEGVRALVALPDNQHALSGSHDHTVQLFNINDGAVLRTFTHSSVENGGVLSMALLPDGLRFVCGSVDGLAFIAEHGLAFAPEPAWLEAEAAARASRKKAALAASAKLRAELQERIDKLSALEAAVEKAGGVVESDARLRALEAMTPRAGGPSTERRVPEFNGTALV